MSAQTDEHSRIDSTKADQPKEDKSQVQVEGKETKEVYLTPYQKKLVEAWEQTHTTPAPLVPNENGTATWRNRKHRRYLAAMARRMNKRRG